MLLFVINLSPLRCNTTSLNMAEPFQLSDKIKERLFNTVTTQYGVDLRSSSENRLITDAWDSMQRSVSTCIVFLAYKIFFILKILRTAKCYNSLLKQIDWKVRTKFGLY